jgi:hypothetical protein
MTRMHNKKHFQGVQYKASSGCTMRKTSRVGSKKHFQDEMYKASPG